MTANAKLEAGVVLIGDGVPTILAPRRWPAEVSAHDYTIFETSFAAIIVAHGYS